MSKYDTLLQIVREEIDIVFNNSYLKYRIDDYFGTELLQVSDIDLKEFFDFDSGFIYKNDDLIEEFSKSFIPIFLYHDETLTGYFVDEQNENSMCLLEFSDAGLIFSIMEVSIVEYFVLSVSKNSSDYGNIKKVLAKDNITIRKRKEILNQNGHFKKVSPTYKRVTNFFDLLEVYNDE